MRLGGISSFTEKKDRALYRICVRWLVKNFGYLESITKVKLLERNCIDVICGIVRVRFEFKGPNGRLGDGVAFLDREEVASAGR